MKKTWLFSSLLLASTVLSAAQTTEAPAYDADLFKRDASVFSFHACFLFWRVQEGALDYALKMQQPSPAGSVFAQGRFHSATFDGEPGFRIAASYFRAPKYWEIWGQYTRLTARGENSVDAPLPADKFLTGTWPSTSTSALSNARSSIHMNYNVADLLVDRFFNPNPHLRMRLLGGGTAAWMDQDWSIHYTNIVNETTQIRNRWKFVGGGFRVGTIVDWFWGYDIYLTATATCASLIGVYHNQAHQTFSTLALPVRDTHFSDVRPAFTVQAIFGPSWQKSFCSTRVEIFAGYELNSWFNIAEFYRSTTATSTASKETWMNTGMIALQGLNARATLDF